MPTISPMPEICDAIHGLCKLLTPAEIAAVAGSLLELADVDSQTVQAFQAELSRRQPCGVAALNRRLNKRDARQATARKPVDVAWFVSCHAAPPAFPNKDTHHAEHIRARTVLDDLDRQLDLVQADPSPANMSELANIIDALRPMRLATQALKNIVDDRYMSKFHPVLAVQVIKGAMAHIKTVELPEFRERLKNMPKDRPGTTSYRVILVDGGFEYRGIAHELAGRPLQMLSALLTAKHFRLSRDGLRRYEGGRRRFGMARQGYRGYGQETSGRIKKSRE